MFSPGSLTRALATLTLLTTTVTAQFTNQSAPFHLRLLSRTNTTLNGSSLYACHEGAAIEAACQLGQMTTNPTSASLFTFNTSSYGGPDVFQQAPPGGITGLLTYLLRGANFNVSEPMNLYFPLSSNVALPLFQPSQLGTAVAFDASGYLNIQDYVLDTQSPPVAGSSKAYYRWYICTTYYSAYTYQTLNWVLGSAPPQNPSCQKVDVIREFS